MQRKTPLVLASTTTYVNNPMPSAFLSENIRFRRSCGKQAGLVNVLTPLALAGATLGLAAKPAQALTLFADSYAPANWTQSIGGNGSIDTSGAPGSVKLTGSDDGSGISANVDFTITASAPGTVSFDWSYNTADFCGPFCDPFGYLLNGKFTLLTPYSGDTKSGSASFSVLSEDVFGFRQASTDSDFGRATTTISNFNGPISEPPPSSVPGPLPLLGAGAAWGWTRRLRQRIATPVITPPRA